VSSCEGMVLSEYSTVELLDFAAEPLGDSLVWGVGSAALVPTNVFPENWDDRVRKCVYRLGSVCPGSREDVSTRSRWSRVYAPRGFGLYVREMCVMRVEVGEVVSCAKEEGLPLGAGKNMSAVGDMVAVFLDSEFAMPILQGPILQAGFPMLDLSSVYLKT
jgi:hypothetical protein